MAQLITLAIMRKYEGWKHDKIKEELFMLVVMTRVIIENAKELSKTSTDQKCQ